MLIIMVECKRPYIKQEEPLNIECTHFLECIKTGKKPLTDGESARGLVGILEAASKSLSHHGQRIQVFNEEKENLEVFVSSNFELSEKAHVI